MVMNSGGIQDRVANVVYSAYSQLNSASKPTVRSNGVKEWTVVAAVLVWDQTLDDLKLLSLATGVKATPNEQLQRSCGKMLHDCHAEILALRGFNTWLLREMACDILYACQSSSLLTQLKGDGIRFRWNENSKLILFISRPPCGDASMADFMDDDDNDNDTLQIQDDDPRQYIDTDIKTILRGRFNFSKKGFVRTKPGRYDSQVTYSKSCSDKLCMKQSLSVLNALTFSLAEKPIFLDYIIIPNLSERRRAYIQASMCNRIQEVPLPIHLATVLTCESVITDDRTNQKGEPSLISSVKIFNTNAMPIEQAIVNGVKNGAYSKGRKPLRRNCETIISRHAQWHLYLRINPAAEHLSYSSLKKNLASREAAKLIIRNHLSADGWIHTSDNSF